MAARLLEEARTADDLVTERIRRLSELADGLLELAAAVRQQSEEMIGDLEHTVRQARPHAAPSSRSS